MSEHDALMERLLVLSRQLDMLIQLECGYLDHATMRNRYREYAAEQERIAEVIEQARQQAEAEATPAEAPPVQEEAPSVVVPMKRRFKKTDKEDDTA